MAKAIVDPMFSKLTKCEGGCDAFFYNDTSEMKLQYQNCTTKCSLTYSSQATQDFMTCGMSHKCLTFSPLGNTTCPFPEPDSESNLESLHGEWWQQYGKNALWDCYPCQHVHKSFTSNDNDFCKKSLGNDQKPLSAPCINYQYSYDLFTETDTKYFGQTWGLPGNIPKGEPIPITYIY